MRTTLSIDDDVLEEVRAIAAADGTSIGAVVTRLLRRGLKPVEVVDRDGFPVFDVPADAPMFGAEQVRAALDDE
ncbi:hypothetical protein BJY21_001539 [Kineosphaera limosa]|uniref:Antitoxin n=1 Tax=Kineosphaera limosa NBRC 100340 TaxID=1184609 RepID=K6VL95_9MICO|nr:ribbon-helix-helix protein, CopG family [Kineosphaera limosa]NYE00355.1 hypothetical protein [Kineosphaera limosa]GAB96993.1 hypothetical protein KILIM_054_00030 [Kineosphaera limosa NBRC 100340]